MRAALVLLALCPGFAIAQSTTSLRGRVTSAGAGLASVEVRLTSAATGVMVATSTDQSGRYRHLGLEPGTWSLTARKPGYGAVVTSVTLELGRTLDLDLTLSASPQRLETLVVRAADKSSADRSTRIDERVIRATPVSGRSFTDLLALVPWVQLGGSAAQGGSITLPGGRRSGTLLQIDGAGASSTFFGGEPRGSDRLPFPYSIEVVKELQISASPFDVTSGGFAGGVINAVTRSGTNSWEASLYGYLRNDGLTAADFEGVPAPDFASRQFGAWIAGPIRRDRMHLFLSVERQAGNLTRSTLPDPGSEPDPATGIHPDSVARLIAILRDVHGVVEQAGPLRRDENEWAVFARLDWQPADRHHLTLRYNSTRMFFSRDLVDAGDLSGNGGDFTARGASAVLRLNSSLGSRWTNEVTLQRATEARPRSAYSMAPQAGITVISNFSGALSQTTARCCNEQQAPTRLAESVWEITDNLHYRRGAHDVTLGGTYAATGILDSLFNLQQGNFNFPSLADLELGKPSQFTRTLPDPGPDGLYFTADDRRPVGNFSVHEAALYLQDELELSRRLRFIAGLRYGRTRYGGKKPAFNQALEAALGLRNDVLPGFESLDPRAGLVWDLSGDGTRLLRIGAGRFTGRVPGALYSGVMLSDGQSSATLRCTGNTVPTPDYRAYQANPASIPTQCANGVRTLVAPMMALIDSGFGVPRSVKMSLSLDQRLSGLVASGGVLYARTTGNYFPVDRNLRPLQFRSPVENRPVYAPPTGINPTNGLVITDSNRISAGFTNVFAHTSPAEARVLQVVLSLAGRFGRGLEGEAAYTFTRARDNGSYTCCAGGPAGNETPNDGDPNDVGRPGAERSGFWGPADFERKHVLVLSGRGVLPYGIRAGGLLRLASGRPWTPEVGGDPNADGRGNNDRAFIGTGLAFGNPAVDEPLLQQHLAKWKCLRDQAGTIATRNHCRDGWSATLDLRLSREIPVGRTFSVEAVLDGFNILNGIDRDWSGQSGVSGLSQNLLGVTGFDRTTGRYIYSVNPGFGLPQDLTASRFDQFSLQLGLRVSYRAVRP